jgi:dTDP-L-rhamnose 4-epimerase
MYEIEEYTSANSYATAALMEALAQRPVRKLVVASSMSIYGEGAYVDGEPVPTPETKLPELTSIYALTKYDQERTCLLVGGAYGIPTVALRLFNVYGPRQALSNPYTGVLAIFAARLLNDRAPRIFEDGEQRRDFVYVDDVVAVNLWLLERREVSGIFNCGTGRAQSFNRLAVAVVNAVHGTSATLHEIVGKKLIEYVPFPEALQGKYQSFTEADMSRLRAAGYPGDFMSVEQGVSAYVKELQGK